MSDRCMFCEEKKPTNHLLLNSGNTWIEFCEDCGKSHSMKNAETGEIKTIQEIYDAGVNHD